MNNRQKLITGLCLGVLCGVVLRTAFAKSAQSLAVIQPPAGATLADNDWKPVNPAPRTLLATNTTQPAATPAKFASAESDGKATLPPVGEDDGKTEIPTDGKETVGKEALPPVGEFINSQPQNVDPSQIGPPTEFRNFSENQNHNPLLNPPNPTNVSGPVVSAETP